MDRGINRGASGTLPDVLDEFRGCFEGGEVSAALELGVALEMEGTGQDLTWAAF